MGRHIKVNLTQEERNHFNTLEDADKQKFMEEKFEYRERLMQKSAILATLLMENMDELKQFNLVRERLKILTKPFQQEVIRYLDELFDNVPDVEQQQKGATYLAHATLFIDEQFERLLNPEKEG